MFSGDQVTVLVAGAFSISEENIRRLQQAAPEIGAVELVADGDRLCARARAARPAVGLVDARVPELTSLAEQFAKATFGGILAVATDPAEAEIVELFARGVMGVVLTHGPVEELITAIRAIAAGHLFVPSRYLSVVAETLLRNPQGARARELRRLLTERELDVLLLMASGQANQEIADRLGISVTTVRSHVLSILRKMNVPNRTVAAISAYRSGLAGV